MRMKLGVVLTAGVGAAVVVVTLIFENTVFMPTPETANFGTLLALVITAALTIRVYVPFLRRERVFDRRGLSARIGLWLLPVVFFLLVAAWTVVGIPSLLTRALGTEASERAVLSKRHSAGRRTCRYKLGGEFFGPFNVGRVCISQKRFDALPNEPSEYVVGGLRSSLGFLVTSAELAPTPAATR